MCVLVVLSILISNRRKKITTIFVFNAMRCVVVSYSFFCVHWLSLPTFLCSSGATFPSSIHFSSTSTTSTTSDAVTPLSPALSTRTLNMLRTMTGQKLKRVILLHNCCQLGTDVFIKSFKLKNIKLITIKFNHV